MRVDFVRNQHVLLIFYSSLMLKSSTFLNTGSFEPIIIGFFETGLNELTLIEDPAIFLQQFEISCIKLHKTPPKK